MKKFFIALFFLLLLTGCTLNFDLKSNENETKMYETKLNNGKISIYLNKETRGFNLSYFKKSGNKWKIASSVEIGPATLNKNWAISSDTKPYLYFGTVSDPQEKIIVGSNDATQVKVNNINFWYYVDFKATKNLSIYQVINGKKILIQP
ncbi:lipoprotein [Bacillus sp. RG28]|uniref:Lipoprotein n=1 Tax=Gottfriedia endophytica TaxID=2820819 RepID=A0A940NLW7_9BACI|nr:lipoprotein [Gottfriedia endophytica]MBP0723848.1 lipoprotein [Gottfriedia endophytica]